MRTLFHYPLCPYSRKIRMLLAEKNLEFSLQFEPVWRKRPEFLDINPAGKVPVLIDHENQVIMDSGVISEYLEEAYPGQNFIGKAIAARAETRRIVAWFDDVFFNEVTKQIVFEKTMKRQFSLGEPNSNVIREGISYMHQHFDYLSWLIERRHWVAGETFSLADMAGAAHISTLDYINHVPWEEYPEIKEWYSRIKCRPSFRGLLNDQVPGIIPPVHYWDLDF
ncbi:glutathione S-transferase family protein [Candidatus Nucleicultrix amoebiphila]|uniref:Glutathione S-transferase n=1 Tax=Candidatus Nucleicultrix amoebiphila FS5 TaxID=1414854 RepID=A0A1W6N451_9PROT|nr:glutathione S-transferase family protein [Candidatus Nucleicultrix amoebiphila]ARN84635.1 glutathione S-transferase [Candidatus Nucleicultrix amoebiphila FS5]